MKRILSGIQPSGAIHIGNYFGMMQKMIAYQNSADLFAFIANYHAMTTVRNGAELAKNTLDTASTFLALGMDPAKATFWVQSDVPEVQELTWVLSTETSMGLLERCHSYKDKTAKGFVPTHGLFAYPVLMSADILLFKSDVVPVGKDQKQHLEVTRDIATRFNAQFGDVFTVPEPEIDDNLAVIPGTDGQKMSKSYGNAIDIFTTKGELKKKVMSIVTDATPIEDPKNPDSCNVFALYRLFSTPEEIAAMRERYLTGPLKYSDVKKELLEKIWNYFGDSRDKKAHYDQNPGEVVDILKEGAKKARVASGEIIEKVRKATGITYW